MEDSKKMDTDDDAIGDENQQQNDQQRQKSKNNNTADSKDVIDLCGDTSSSSSDDDDDDDSSSCIEVYRRKKKKAKKEEAEAASVAVRRGPTTNRRNRTEHRQQDSSVDSSSSSATSDEDDEGKEPPTRKRKAQQRRRRRSPTRTAEAPLKKKEEEDDDDSSVADDDHDGKKKKKSESCLDSDVVEVVLASTKRPRRRRKQLRALKEEDEDEQTSGLSSSELGDKSSEEESRSSSNAPRRRDDTRTQRKTRNENNNNNGGGDEEEEEFDYQKKSESCSDSDVVEVVLASTKRPQHRRKQLRTLKEEDEDEQMSGLSSSELDDKSSEEESSSSSSSNAPRRRDDTRTQHKTRNENNNNNGGGDEEEEEFEWDYEEESESEDEEFMKELEMEAEAIQQRDGDDDDLSIASEATDPRERALHGKALDGYQRESTRKRGEPVDDVIISSSNVKPLPVPTSREKRDEVLSGIKNPSDRNLQRLLWHLGCGYELLSYQFLGVRAMVGVEHLQDYPQQYISVVDDDNNNGDDDDDDEDEDEPLVDWQQVLKRTELTTKRGCLMADCMGMGKTVQAVVASILLNAIYEAKNPRDKKPTIIVSPNDAVTRQWIETLVHASIPTGRIFKFITKDTEQRLVGNIYVLMNRYQLQTEAKYVFQLVAGMNKAKSHTKRLSLSPLFPKVSKLTLQSLCNQYMAQNGKATNKHRRGNEEICECTTRLLREAAENSGNPPAFRFVVIDEAHFLKNLVTFWGEGAGLLCAFSSRVVPMSGTPYNNRAQDLATLMTFIDPRLPSATENWWRAATSTGAAASVVNNVSEWNKSYLVRREKRAIGSLLPEKHIAVNPVLAFPMELHVYEQYEQSFLQVLEKFTRLTDDNSPPAMLRKKQLFEQLLAAFTCMRMCLIHGVLPNGRDFTIQFSPTRRHLVNTLSKPWLCVCCGPGNNNNNKKKKLTRSDISELLGDNNLVDDEDNEFIAPDDDEDSKGMDKGDMVEIPLELCLLCNTDSGLRHYAHSSCLDRLEGTCPLCEKLVSHAQLSSGAKAMEEIESKVQQYKPAESSEATTAEVNLEIDRQILCKEILGGFKPSAKIESIIDHLTKRIPNNEKCLVLSFFKGSLDLIEAILFYELGMEYSRFDGDVCSEIRQKELDRFKQSPTCRFLLMTVQTGGTGLNIVQANHCIFVDRWFNPFVHEQAQDRIHRLKQKKECYVTYYDVSYTVDNVVQMLNDKKMMNATIVLADGSTSLSAASASVSYQDMAGLLGQAVRAVKAARISLVKSRSSDFADRLPALDPSFDFQPEDNNGGFLRTPRGRAQDMSLLNVFAQILGLDAPDDTGNQKTESIVPAPRRITPEITASSTAAAASSSDNNGNYKQESAHCGSDSDDDDDDSSFDRLIATPYLNPKASSGRKKSGATGAGGNNFLPRVVRFPTSTKSSRSMSASAVDASSNNVEAQNQSLLPDRAPSAGSFALRQPKSMRRTATIPTTAGLDDEDDDASFERLLATSPLSNNKKKKSSTSNNGKSSSTASSHSVGQKAAGQPLYYNDEEDSSSTSS